MKDAIMVHSGELTSRPRYDSTFKWEYLPRKSQNLDYEIEDLYDKVILVIRTKNGKVTKVIKSHKYESLEIMKSSFKSKIAGLVEEYWVTECVYGPFNDLKTFKTTYQNISDWETLSKCNFASWDIDISDKERYQLQVSFEIDYEEEKYEDMITVYEEIK
ncbi:hypothetical protein [Salinibacter ruber]|uniref:hypothetical protein n=1 Tax=Salinibacter ruber TaxID=146919 RepID=UPI0021695994|nr:hypothetical protein [Salinibacter ruber]